MRIAVLALEGVFDSGLSVALDAFGIARDLAGRSGPRLEVELVGVRSRVRTGQGLQVPVCRADPDMVPDLAFLPALGAKTPQALDAALARRDVADAIALLRTWAAQRARVAAACTGTFVLAESGLLDGRAATTSWWLGPCFRERFPLVALEEGRMVVPSAGVVTAGAALAHLDLALWIIRQRSPRLAAEVARYLVVEPRPSQAAFAIPDQLAHEDPLVERFEAWARRHFRQPFSLSAAARSAGASERTLARRMRAVLGKSPLGYVQDLRVEQAVHLLQTTGASVDEVASAIGYGDGVTLRVLLRRKLGRSVRDIRRSA